MVKVRRVTLAASILFVVLYLELLHEELGQGRSIHIIVVVPTRAELFEDLAALSITLIYTAIKPCFINK